MEMKSKVFMLFFLLSISVSGFTQIVKFIKNPYQAKYRVYISLQPKQATHWIYKVKSPSDIKKPGHWYIVTNPQLFSNAMTLYKVEKIDDADFIVYYVNTSDSATIKLK
jgi:hypothetical protein